MTGLHWIDWIIVALFLLVTVGIGLYFTKRAGSNIASFFLTGRVLPWYIAGTAWVASAFASDTPLWVSALVRRYGVYYLWQYWSPLIGMALAAVLFARLWRRLGVLTDVELLENRYNGKLAGFLRFWEGGTKALFFAPLVIGWVVKAMEVIGREAMGLPEEYRVWTTIIVVGLGLVMVTMSGLWGVVYTGVFQFILATTGTIILAALSIKQVGGLSAMVEQLSAMTEWSGHNLNIMPDIGSGPAQMSIWNAIGYFCILWFITAFAGDYAAQRILACKDSRHSSFTVLCFSILYYSIMAWPWIIVGLCSLIIFPDLGAGVSHDSAYPRMIVEILPIGLRGMIVAAMIAAFVSTVTTLFNWGSSYIVNDLYKRFLVRNASDKHYVNVSRLATIGMAIAGGVISFVAKDIQQLLEISYVIMPSVVVVGLLRWLWWRLTPVGDLAGTATAWLLSPLMLFAKVFDGPARVVLGLDESVEFSGDPNLLGARMGFVILSVFLVSVVVSLFTKPNDTEHLKKFVLKARPPKFLWKKIVDQLDVPYHAPETFWRTLISWILATTAIGSLVFSIGKFLLGSPWMGVFYLILCAVTLYLTVKRINADFAEEQLDG